MHRIILLVISKFKSIFQPYIAFSSQVEYSSISKKSRIWSGCKVFHSILGDYSYLGRRSRLIHAHVGKFCSISSDCAIGMGTHSLENISTSSVFTAKRNGVGVSWAQENLYEEFKPVIIGNDVWIGQRVMIMGGIHVGNGAVVGAGAVVTKDIPPYAIVGGVPAKVIRYRFPDEVIQKLEDGRWWMLTDSVLKDNIKLFQDPLAEGNLEKLVQLTLNNKGRLETTSIAAINNSAI